MPEYILNEHNVALFLLNERPTNLILLDKENLDREVVIKVALECKPKYCFVKDLGDGTWKYPNNKEDYKEATLASISESQIKSIKKHSVLHFASQRLRSNKKFILSILDEYKIPLYGVSEELLDDAYVASKLVGLNGFIDKNLVSERLANNIDFVIKTLLPFVNSKNFNKNNLEEIANNITIYSGDKEMNCFKAEQIIKNI